MRFSRYILIGLTLFVPSSMASAWTPAEIEAAAIVARNVDIVEAIADDVFEGRNNDTPGSIAVQTLLIDELKLISDGLNSSETGDDAYRQSFATTQIGTNLLGVIPGSDLAGEYVMLGAHYDSAGKLGGDVFNGATDNAAGVAIVLAIGEAIQSLPTPPRRSVILAFWDAEEDGLVGSLAYATAPLVPLNDVVAYLNWDVQGANLLPSLRDLTFSIGAESGGAILQGFAAAAAAAHGLDTRVLTRVGGQDRSDHANFINLIPSVFFSDATGGCYHDRDDDIRAVDLAKLREQSQIGFRTTIALTETSTPPTWVATAIPPSFPAGLPIYEDVAGILAVLDGAVADIARFTASQQSELLTHQAILQAIVAAGPGSFDLIAMINLQNAVVFGLGSLGTLRCDGFGPLELAKESERDPVGPTVHLTYTLTAENVGSFDAPSTVISDKIPAGATYIGGSASDGGSESGGVVNWPPITLTASSTAVRTFRVVTDASFVGGLGGFSDDMESGSSSWIASHVVGPADWALVTTNADSGLNSWHAVDLAVNGDQILTTSAPIPIPASGATLAFSHDYDTESSWDGGVVEISTDQVIWSDLGPFALENPYNVTLNSSSNPLSGRPAYSGTGMGYLRSRFDLSSYGGSNVWIRFRMGSDSIIGGKGWWIDDVWIGELIPNEAWVDAGGAALAEARETVHVPEPTQVWMLFAGISALFVLSRRRFHS